MSTTNRNSPSVTMMNGSDRSWTIGFNHMFTTVNTAAAMSSVHHSSP